VSLNYVSVLLSPATAFAAPGITQNNLQLVVRVRGWTGSQAVSCIWRYTFLSTKHDKDKNVDKPVQLSFPIQENDCPAR